MLEALAAAGHAALAHQLDALRPSSPAQAAVLRALGAALESAGPAGLEQLAGAVVRALEGEVPDVTALPLREASGLLATLQRLEGDERSAVRDTVTRATQLVAPVVGAVLGLVV